jgi:hypothetical protein
MQVHLFACKYSGVTRIDQLEHQLEPFEGPKEDTEFNSYQDYCLTPLYLIYKIVRMCLITTALHL